MLNSMIISCLHLTIATNGNRGVNTIIIADPLTPTSVSTSTTIQILHLTESGRVIQMLMNGSRQFRWHGT